MAAEAVATSKWQGLVNFVRESIHEVFKTLRVVSTVEFLLR